MSNCVNRASSPEKYNLTANYIQVHVNIYPEGCEVLVTAFVFSESLLISSCSEVLERANILRLSN